MKTPCDLFRQTADATGDRILAIRAIRSRFGLSRDDASAVMRQAEGSPVVADMNVWPDYDYVPYLDAEQQLFAWILTKVAGIDPEEALHKARARFHYESESERGIMTNQGAWRIAMCDLFGDHRHVPEEFGVAAEFEAEFKRLFHHS